MAEDALQGYLSGWKLSAARPLATTATSTLYLVTHDGGAAVLKILSDIGRRDEGGSAAALAYFGGNGAVNLLRHDDGAQLLEYAEGEDLKDLVRRGHDAEAAAIIGDVLNKLHAAWRKPPPPELKPLRTWFRSLFVLASEKDALTVYARAAAVAERLLGEDENPVVLHGDIHHENIRQSPRGWLALDPKGLYGPRLFDAANALCNPSGMEALVENEARMLANAEIIAGKLGAPREKLLAFLFAYAGLSASWSLEDGDDPGHALRMAELAEKHVKAG